MASRVTDAEVQQAEDVLRRLHEACGEDENEAVDPSVSPASMDSLAEAAFLLFGRRFKKKVFGDREVVEWLKEQTNSHKLLRRLERLHDIVQEKHASNIEDARGSGINSMREARTVDINSSQGFAALTTQHSLAALVGDLRLLRGAEAEAEIGVGFGVGGAAGMAEGGKETGKGTEGGSPGASAASGHYGCELVPVVSEHRINAGIGRSRGRKAKFQTSRVRGMYDSVEEEEEEEAEAAEEDEEQEGGGDGAATGAEKRSKGGTCRKRGTLHLVPREGASLSQHDVAEADLNAAHAGLWLCYVTDDEDGKSRACAHRTVVDMAGSLENLGRPLALDGGSKEYPCTYIIGQRRQHWALLGGAVSGLCGETAIAVKLAVSVLLGQQRLLTDGSVVGATRSDPLSAPHEGEFRRHCNICKSEYLSLHSFYHQLCPRCGDFNFAKRLQSAQLGGFVCLVTGGRVRIGLQIALKLLRAGATVVVTSRFVHDAAARYEAEADYASFRARLCIDSLELTDLQAVEAYCVSLKQRFARIHVLVNNAAQTITRAPEWLGKMGQLEAGARLALRDAQPLQSEWNAENPRVLALTNGVAGVGAGAGLGAEAEAGAAVESGSAAEGAVGAEAAADACALVPLSIPPAHTRAHLLDESGQPLDASGSNSWSRRLEEVSTDECTQTLAVNAVAPLILCAKLKEALRPRDPRDPAEPWGHIVNVSSLEGKFNVGKKSGGHPHTNMAKAALNMMTLTSAREYARCGVLMNSVDTGWITDMAPGNVGNASRASETFVGPPLDEVDGAARVLDPVFSHVNSGGAERTHGQFLKDYLRASW